MQWNRHMAYTLKVLAVLAHKDTSVPLQLPFAESASRDQFPR
jgi:hypothetical protein